MDFHISEILKRYVKEGKIQNRFYLEKIRSYWQKEISSSISTRTRHLHFKNGVLTITTDSAALRNELFNHKDRIREILNSFLGEEAVLSVIVR